MLVSLGSKPDDDKSPTKMLTPPLLATSRVPPPVGNGIDNWGVKYVIWSLSTCRTVPCCGNVDNGTASHLTSISPRGSWREWLGQLRPPHTGW